MPDLKIGHFSFKWISMMHPLLENIKAIGQHINHRWNDGLCNDSLTPSPIFFILSNNCL